MTAPPPAADEDFRKRLVGSNVNEQTLLATDYLNHFNEVVMLIEMIPDMPECLEDALEWQPKSYQQHFRDSTLSEGELAAEAYERAPSCYRVPFDETVRQLNGLIERSLGSIAKAIEADESERLAVTVQTATQALQRLIEMANGTIHGSVETLAQDEVDRLLGGLPGG